MPYYRKRRYSYRKPSYAQCAGKVAKDAQRALKGVSMLKGIINSELHVHDTAISSNISSTGTVTSLSGVAQGDQTNERTGRSIMCKSIQLRSTCSASASATATKVRYVIFSDAQNQGATPAVTDVLKSASPTSMNNVLTEQGRFKILMDKLLVVDPATRNTSMCNKFIKLGNHHIYFEGTAAANVGRGSLWLLQVSNEATNTPSQDSHVRIRYYDN